jgi:hypothetical protein
MAYNQAQDVRCVVSGPAWAAYVRGGGETRTLRGRATLRNPPYDA